MGDGGARLRGVIVGPLKEVHPDRITVGDSTFFLRDGVACRHTSGTRVQVVYTEQDGRRDVDLIAPIRYLG